MDRLTLPVTEISDSALGLAVGGLRLYVARFNFASKITLPENSSL